MCMGKQKEFGNWHYKEEEEYEIGSSETHAKANDYWILSVNGLKINISLVQEFGAGIEIILGILFPLIPFSLF